LVLVLAVLLCRCWHQGFVSSHGMMALLLEVPAVVMVVLALY
jgi:hypothetical protein